MFDIKVYYLNFDLCETNQIYRSLTLKRHKLKSILVHVISYLDLLIHERGCQRSKSMSYHLCQATKPHMYVRIAEKNTFHYELAKNSLRFLIGLIKGCSLRICIHLFSIRTEMYFIQRLLTALLIHLIAEYNSAGEPAQCA